MTHPNAWTLSKPERDQSGKDEGRLAEDSETADICLRRRAERGDREQGPQTVPVERQLQKHHAGGADEHGRVLHKQAVQSLLDTALRVGDRVRQEHVAGCERVEGLQDDHFPEHGEKRAGMRLSGHAFEACHSERGTEGARRA